MTAVQIPVVVTAGVGVRWRPDAGFEAPGEMDRMPGEIDSARQPEFDKTHSKQNIQRALSGTGTSQDEVPEQVLDVIGSGGTPLDKPIQRSLEDRMDANFSDVRIHTGAKAAEAADAIDAKAFTCGNDIVFNSGEYNPESPEGQHLLAHELAHVKQQNGGAPLSMMPKENADLEIDPDPQLEREADQAAQEALSEGPVTISRMGTDVHIQRYNSGERGLMASNLKDTNKLKDQVSELDQQVQSNTSEIDSLNQTVDEALQTPDLSEIEGELTTEDGGLADDALTHLTELNKSQAGMAGGLLVSAGMASANPALIGAGLSVGLGGPVAANALEQKSSGGDSVELSGEFLDPLADAVAKRLDERDGGTYPG